jgi:hypothetical protein
LLSIDENSGKDSGGGGSAQSAQGEGQSKNTQRKTIAPGGKARGANKGQAKLVSPKEAAWHGAGKVTATVF